MTTHANATGPLLDPAAISESKELMGDKFNQIVGYFLDDSTMYVTQVEHAFTAADIEALVVPVHTLKSSSRQMGALQLSLLAGQIENNARDLIKHGGDIRSLAPQLEALQQTLAATLAAYREAIGASAAA